MWCAWITQNHPPPLVCEKKIVFYEISPWYQKSWGLQLVDFLFTFAYFTMLAGYLENRNQKAKNI